MDCRHAQDRLTAFLRGRVPEEERRAIEEHLESCEACQALPVIPAALQHLLRERMPRSVAPQALRRRIEAALREAAAPAQRGALPQPVPHEPAPAPAPDAAWGWLRSGWVPRLAMVAVVAFVVLVPVRLWLRAPVLAEEAVERHEHHLTSDWSALTCCKPLDLHPGDPLGDPSRGARVPDLSADGLHLLAAGRCDDGGVEVTGLIYRSEDGQQTFSLYITDRELDNFHAMRTRDSGGIREARHEVRQSEVTIWEQDGLVWFWIGPRANPEYATALADLRTY